VKNKSDFYSIYYFFPVLIAFLLFKYCISKSYNILLLVFKALSSFGNLDLTGTQ